MIDHSTLLFAPNIIINGMIDERTVAFFLGRIEAVRCEGADLVLELNTMGGDADAARRIALEIRLFTRHSGRKAYCIGKTAVYSAGITILAAFPRSTRYLTDDAILLIHERRISKTITLEGPMKSNLQIVREQLALMETAEKLEKEGFSQFVEGSMLTPDDLFDRATDNCYMTAEEALELGLISQILR